MTYTYVVLEIPKQAYDFIHAKLTLANYHHAIHYRGAEEVCDLSGIAVQAEALSDDLTTRAARLHDAVHEVTALTTGDDPLGTICWAPGGAIPIRASAPQRGAQAK